MNAKDQYKLLKAGFMIIRADEQKLRIKCKLAARPEWHYQSMVYKSKAALRRAMDELLELERVVED